MTNIVFFNLKKDDKCLETAELNLRKRLSDSDLM